LKVRKFKVWDTYKTDTMKVTKEHIIEFATKYDPQYLHIDEEKAEQTRFKGIIASGVHTLAMSLRLWIDTGKYGEDLIAGLEINDIKFLKPVYPGDEIYSMGTVLDVEEKQNKTGILTLRLSTFNQREEQVFQADFVVLMKND